MLGGLGILLLFLSIGEAASALGIGLPGNVVGMLLLTAALALGIVRVERVRQATDVLLDNLAFLFVPPGVGVMVHFGVLGRSWVALSVAVLISTVAVLVVTGVVTQWLLRRGGRWFAQPGNER
ncbi:MAG: CidA/LrgA family protein [Spirochaetaceae bacterium]|nr:MAG: CidA/LrgA family protein [Spirochaetaceae bacterium]